MDKTEEYWRRFLKLNKLDSSLRYKEAFYFGFKESADELLELVLEGKKRATSSLLKAYEIEDEPLPVKGEYSIVLNSKEEPCAVIETTDVYVLPYNQMTFEICKKEGEDDCLESWKRNHEEFFKKDLESMGIEFKEDMEIVFEEFKKVYPRDNLTMRELNMPDADIQMLKNDRYEEDMYRE